MIKKKYQNYNNFLRYTDLDLKKVTSEIKRSGYGVLKNVIPANKCEYLIKHLVALHESHFKKFGKSNLYKYSEEAFAYNNQQLLMRNLILEKPKIFMPVISLFPVLKVVSNIINETFIIDGCIASNSVSRKETDYKGKRHIDSHLAMKEINNTLDVVAILCLNGFNISNGSTKIWPRSHKTGIEIHRNPLWSKKYLHNFKHIIAPQGSIAFVLGHTWHSIGKNINNVDRWSILLHYKRWWIKPSTDYTKCGEKIFNNLNSEQKILLGFNSIVPKFNNKNRSKTLIKKNKIPRKYKEALSY